MAFALPLRIAHSSREIDQFNRMSIRIAKLESGNTACLGRQVLRAIPGDRNDVVMFKPLVGSGHVCCYKGDVVEPQIRRCAVAWIGSAGWIELGQADMLVSKAQQSGSKRQVRVFGLGSGSVRVGNGFEPKRVLVERDAVVQRPDVPLDSQKANNATGLSSRNHGRCAPRTLRKIEYKVCDPQMNSRL